ncbi:unnamed protein product [Lactuca saligna]|uniref:Uncharacterized protein n=1 Tax=Lactuca saligna TaxID=75948 RepID=A0AA36EFY7_LACSI|nr:unnamed protein product [Lactuca saligna]
MVDETLENVIIPSKTGMFRRIKMKSTHKRKSSLQKLVRKPQITHQGVLIRNVPALVFPGSKKQVAEDMAKHLSQSKKKKFMKTRKLVLSTESTDEDQQIPETPEFTPIVTSSIPETNVIKTPEVSIAKSIFEEVRTSGIPAHVSDMDANVNMGEGGSKDAAQGPIIFTPTSTIPLTSTTVSPTFEHILNQPFTSIFPSQSTDTPKPSSPTDTDNEGFGGTFKNMEFNEDEEEFPDHMLMTMKQYKILNQKLNSIIQPQADLGGSSSISSLEVDSMLKMFESRIINKVSRMLEASDFAILEKEVNKVNLFKRKFFLFNMIMRPWIRRSISFGML